VNKKQQAARIKRVKLLQQVNTEKNCFEKAMQSQGMEIMDHPVVPQLAVADDSWTEIQQSELTVDQMILTSVAVTAAIINGDRQPKS
jgi:hypothetical protein